MMCEHRPETAECLGRDAGTEHWNIAFEIGADKILPPSLACPIARRKEAIGKSAAYPKPVNLIIADFKPVERTHFEVADTSGETLSRLAQKIDRCRAEEQEAACPLASTPTGVDQPAQDLEQSRQTMDFVEDDQLVRMSGKIKFGFRQLGAIRIGLEVEGLDSPISTASVVLPTCLGPMSATAGTSANLSASSVEIRRSIILAFMEFYSSFARLICITC
jgi:hypothetical protein